MIVIKMAKTFEKNLVFCLNNDRIFEKRAYSQIIF
jgi:hypothetical protein